MVNNENSPTLIIFPEIITKIDSLSSTNNSLQSNLLQTQNYSNKNENFINSKTEISSNRNQMLNTTTNFTKNNNNPQINLFQKTSKSFFPGKRVATTTSTPSNFNTFYFKDSVLNKSKLSNQNSKIQIIPLSKSKIHSPQRYSIASSLNSEFNEIKNKNNNQINLQRIINELEILDVQKLMKNVDPSIKSKGLLNQIIEYEKAIKNEILIINNQMKRENKGTKSKKEYEKKILRIKNPKLPNYISFFTEAESYNTKNYPSRRLQSSGSVCLQQIPLGSTKLDYKILVHSLENDITIINQKINDQKYRNVLLSNEVEEIRKNLICEEVRCRDLSMEYIELEKDFLHKKEYYLAKSIKSKRN